MRRLMVALAATLLATPPAAACPELPVPPATDNAFGELTASARAFPHDFALLNPLLATPPRSRRAGGGVPRGGRLELQGRERLHRRDRLPLRGGDGGLRQPLTPTGEWRRSGPEGLQRGGQPSGGGSGGTLRPDDAPGPRAL